MCAKKREKPRLAVIDCETDPFGWNKKQFDDNEVHPFVWGLYIIDDSAYFEFWNDDLSAYGDYSGTRKLLTFLQDENLLIYAHNGGKFDYMFLLPWFDEDILLVNGRIAKARIGNCEFRDSFMILPVPLSAMDKDTEFDYGILHFNKRKHHTTIISNYLKSDCINLAKWVGNFINRYGIKFTLASTSMDEIKKAGIDVIKTDKIYDSEMRPYYFGGRTQCFQKGYFSGPLVYYDINSAYPYAMLHNHPMGKTRLPLPKNKKGEWVLPPKGAVFFVTVQAISKGCLPIRDPETGKLEYPVDNVIREYKATCWEVWAGLETNTLHIIKILDGCRYLTVGNFERFIIPYYELKKASPKDSPEYLFSKLIQNAGYGKFGINPERYEQYKILEKGFHPMDEIPEPEYDDPNYLEWLDEFESWGLYAEHKSIAVWKRKNPGNHYNNVATAASITGFVRAFLWRHICAAEGVIYCDTDSIICKRFLGDVGNELGQWSLECGVKNAWIAQRKMYCIEMSTNPWKSKIETKRKKKRNVTTVSLEYCPDYKVASKGVRLSPREIIDGVNNGGEVTYEKPSPAFSVKYLQRFLRKTIDFDA